MNRKILSLLAALLMTGPAGLSTAQAAGQDRSAAAVVNSKCIECHGDGKQHAPRIGDRDDWIKRASKGLDGLVLAATRGHDGMPARGGRPDLTDAEFKAAIFHMFTLSVSAPDKK